MSSVDDLGTVLARTGVRHKIGGKRTGHLLVFPASNLKPWTEEEQAALENAARTLTNRNGYPREITYRMVRASGRYFEEYEAQPGYGFRVY